MTTSLSNIKVTDGTNNMVIKADDITLNGTSVLVDSATWGNIDGTLSDQTDLNTALNDKQDEATAVNYDNITNCITEIPQDIKLELNNGTLTLKAGSKVYVPNGFESDGTTPKFDEVVISSDITYQYSDASVQQMLFYNYLTSSLTAETLSKVSSGSTISPTASYSTRYDTTINKIIRSIDGTTWSNNYQDSLPICIQTVTSGTGVTSIDQVFNGFGYIGSTIFALPGVKGLVPSGRNEDGSLKNIEFTLNGVQTVSLTTQTFTNRNFVLRRGDMGFSSIVYYNAVNNTNYGFPAYMIAATGSVSSGKITSFTPKTAFHAVDYNDFESLSNTVDTKQNILISGTNIKTINSESIIGSGNLTVTADTSDCVKLTGNQTITGTKTFSNDTYHNANVYVSNGRSVLVRNSGSNYYYFLDRTDLATSETTPDSALYEILIARAANGDNLGQLMWYQTTGGEYFTDLSVHRKVNGTEKSASLRVAINSSGDVYTAAPTPATSDNSTQIATTAYINNKFKVVSSLPASPDADTFYFVTT